MAETSTKETASNETVATEASTKTSTNENAPKETVSKENNSRVLIRLKAYEPAILDKTASEIAEVARKEGASVKGPFPLPTHKEIITILRSVHINKDSREQFEQRTHKRLIELKFAPKKAIKALSEMKIPAGVNVDFKM